MDGGSLWFLKITSLLSPFVPVSHVSKDLQRYQSNQLAQKSQGEPATSCQTEMEEAGEGGGRDGFEVSVASLALLQTTQGTGSPKAHEGKGRVGVGVRSLQEPSHHRVLLLCGQLLGCHKACRSSKQNRSK